MPSTIRVGRLAFGNFTLETNCENDFQIMNNGTEALAIEDESNLKKITDTIHKCHGDEVSVVVTPEGTYALADASGKTIDTLVTSEHIQSIVESHVAKLNKPGPLAAPGPAVTYLTQKDFDDGCYFIYKPGKYELLEDIVCDFRFEEQLNPDGTINAKFTGNSNSSVASIGIAVLANDVTINGNGFSIKQSGSGATANRIFTAIQLSGNKALDGAIKVGANNPTAKSAAAFFANNHASFGGGGPSDEFANHFHLDIGYENIVIENMNFGRSSHFHIHGTNNRGVTVKNCRFFEFEVAALWLNNQVSLKLEDLDIVGMDKFEQSLTWLWGFRAQGTGLRGIVNASYWGIILNQQQGGVNLIFPPASGSTLVCPEAGQDREVIDMLCDSEFTTGGINRQRVGPRAPILKNIRISNLRSQMISGYCLARQDSTGNTVPILFDSESDNSIKRGSGGHMGYRAKYSVQIEAIKDGCAWYPNAVSWLYYKGSGTWNNADTTPAANGLQAFLDAYTVRDADGAPVTSGFDDVLLSQDLGKYALYDPAGEPVVGRRRCESVRLADRAFKWKKNSHGVPVEGLPEYIPEHVGFVEYRGTKDGKETKDIDTHLFNFSNVYSGPGKLNLSMGPYEASKVKCFSDESAAGESAYYDDVEGASGWRATRVVAIVGSMIANHAGPMEVAPGAALDTGVLLPTNWWWSKNFGFQEANTLPIDFGGHQMNGVVSIHCDRVWGGVFEDITVVNAENLRTRDYLGLDTGRDSKIAKLGAMKGYTHELDLTEPGVEFDEAIQGFSASSWSIMVNDSGGNIFKNCHSLNMLARTGASFAIHMAFGSRGNIVEDCTVLSNTGGEMWGFVTDKGSYGNLFRRCIASDIVGSLAAAAFVARGNGSVFEDCKANGVKVVTPASHADDALRAKRLASHPFAFVAAGFLADFGGTDEFEFPSRYRGSNTFKNCEVVGVLAHGEHQVDRNAEIIRRRKLTGTLTEAENTAIDSFVLNSKVAASAITCAGFMVQQQANNYFENCTARYIRTWKDQSPLIAASFEDKQLLTATSLDGVTGGDAGSYVIDALESTPWTA